MACCPPLSLTNFIISTNDILVSLGSTDSLTVFFLLLALAHLDCPFLHRRSFLSPSLSIFLNVVLCLADDSSIEIFVICNFALPYLPLKLTCLFSSVPILPYKMQHISLSLNYDHQIHQLCFTLISFFDISLLHIIKTLFLVGTFVLCSLL